MKTNENVKFYALLTLILIMTCFSFLPFNLLLMSLMMMMMMMMMISCVLIVCPFRARCSWGMNIST